jgi:hypothetical protein
MEQTANGMIIVNMQSNASSLSSTPWLSSELWALLVPPPVTCKDSTVT